MSEMFWGGVTFGALFAWLGNEWIEFCRAEFRERRTRAKRESQFRDLEAAAVLVAKRLSDTEKALIRLSLYR